MRRVFLISPYAGDVANNVAYMQRCMHDCLLRGEAPFAPHGLYPQCLDDGDPAQRALGIAAGQAFLSACHLAACYVDRGISSGMRGDLKAFVTPAYVALKNERIRAPRVLLIDEHGDKLGEWGTPDALALAHERHLDLVTINPKADPPVCRILDWSKYTSGVHARPVEYRSLNGPPPDAAWLRANDLAG